MATAPKDGKLLWHLTSLNNIESIFKNGLLSRKKLDAENFTDIADTEILESRTKFGLEHYIPFHFMQKTPFAGIVMKKNSDKEFVYLTLQRTLAIKNNFKIITKHPLSTNSEMYEYQEGFSKIKWELMEGDRDYKIQEVKETCMAECIGLVEFIPINGFHCIYTKTRETKNYLDELKNKYNAKIFIDFNPNFFV
jgi:hypothetical protein